MRDRLSGLAVRAFAAGRTRSIIRNSSLVLSMRRSTAQQITTDAARLRPQCTVLPLAVGNLVRRQGFALLER
jgi:hypothetical protein